MTEITLDRLEDAEAELRAWRDLAEKHGFTRDVKRAAQIFDDLSGLVQTAQALTDSRFGVAASDSVHLLELRSAIDTYLGWGSLEEEERADYVTRIQQVAEMLQSNLGPDVTRGDLERELLAFDNVLLEFGIEAEKGVGAVRGVLGRSKDLEDQVRGLQVELDRREERTRRQRKELKRLNHELRAWSATKLDWRLRQWYTDPTAKRKRLTDLVKSLPDNERAELKELLESR